MFARVLFALGLALALVGAARAAPVDSGHVTAELIAQDAAAVPGSTVYVALRQDIEPGWHTYWRNPGDSGNATALAWTLPEGWLAGDIVWATPERISTGPADNAILNYVYSGQVILPIPITVPANARPGTSVTFSVGVSYLVCADVCVPESARLNLIVPVAAASSPDPRWGAPIAAAIAAAPKPSGLSATFLLTGGHVVLGITGAALADADLTGADFFAFDGHAIRPAAPLSIERGPQGLSFTLAPQEGIDPSVPAPIQIPGILVLRSGAYEVTAHLGPISPGARGQGQVARAPGGGLLLNAALAFLGGIILNLMPCVFPVLSMKAASLAGHAHEAKGARMQGIAFLVGVLATFLALAGLLIAARAGGEAVGWGFQLQDPRVIAVLALVVMAVGLNLSGVFEMGLSVQGAGSGLASRSGLAGSFFTGALAVVVAAPCTAPFMATAVGYAATQPPLVALTVFAALALGFAAPFTALSFAPALWRRMPRPGVWMERLRQVLAFPMYGAAGWLVWVLSQQAGNTGLARILAALLALSFAAWLFGLTQKGGGRVTRLAVLTLAALVGAAAFAGVVWPAYPVAQAAAAAHTDIPSEPYSPERFAAVRAEGRPVFVNFTAAWCVTCQVNERAALSSPAVAEAFRSHRVAYLVGDWTNRDAVIAHALAEHGRDGVPLYLVYPASGAEPRVLPQLLTEGAVIEAVERASDRH